MNAPVPSRRRLVVLLIWCGGVAMVLAGAFTLAWVKLPEWQPKWVIEHSPWADPAVRAMIHYDVKKYTYPSDHAMDWGAAIGPVLRRLYEHGSVKERLLLTALAVATLEDNEDTLEFRRLPDGRSLSAVEALALREDLRWLAIRASADGSWDARYHALPLITALRDPDLNHLPCDWLISGTADIHNTSLIDSISNIKDHRAVPRLIPRLVTTLEPYERTMLFSALRNCLAPSQVAEVLNATTHPDRYVREWAASVIDQVNADQALETQLIGLLSDSESDVRLTALNTVIRKGITDEFHAALIARLDDQTHEIRRIVLDAIITQKVPSAFRAAFIARLRDPAADLRLKVIDAIGEHRIRDGGEPLLARLTLEPELSLRISAIDALGRLKHVDAKPVLRQIANQPQDRMQGAAIVTLGTFRDPMDYSLLLTLLSDEDDDIARKARIALGYLPLTPDQQKQIDALWDAAVDDDVPAPAPAISSPP